VARGGRDERETAAGFYEQALALAEELKMRPLVARTHLGLGQLHARAGNRSETHEHLAMALGLLREMDIRFWSARAVHELMGLGNLFIVARHDVALYNYLKQEFAGEPITVILDRRQADRRQHDDGAPADGERRRGDRRRSGQLDEVLRNRGFVVVPESGA